MSRPFSPLEAAGEGDEGRQARYEFNTYLAEGFVTQIFPLSGGFNILTVFSYKPLRYN